MIVKSILPPALLSLLIVTFIVVFEAAAAANLIDSQNVFGWQKTKQQHKHWKESTDVSRDRQQRGRGGDRGGQHQRHHSPSLLSPSSLSSSSPLRRSENVFGWQQRRRQHPRREQRPNNDSSIQHTSSKTNPQNIKEQQTISSSGRGTSVTTESHTKHHISPPNIKLQPRKKELWLPWPLGALRNDFYEFAANQRQYHQPQSQQRQEWHPRGSQQQQQQIKSYYSDDFYDQQQHQHSGILQEGKTWATNMIRRGSSMLPFSTFNNYQASSRSGSENNLSAERPDERGEEEANRYWVRDTTTPMATASATIMGNANKKGNRNNKNGGKNKSKQQQQQHQNEGASFRGGDNHSDDNEESDKHFDKDVIFRYLKLQASVRLRQLGYVGSDFSVHLPPASPILLFYYFYPSKQDPIRRLCKYTLTGAALSWMHSEATKYRRFAALPVMKGINVRQPELPPFLPEEMAGGEVVVETAVSDKVGKGAVVATKSNKGSAASTGKARVKAEKETANNGKEEESTHNTHHLWDPFQSFGTLSSAYRTWLEGYNMRNKQSYQQRRIQAQEQLLELKKNKNELKDASNSTVAAAATATGYALITGASGGIGRAIAVELARYQIPLILVARDLARLSSVAKDIEMYYGVPCRILQADLSAPDCASRIHAATTAEGLDVDILVNNAGICDHGNFLESDATDFARMIQVNIGATTQLSRLYGADMKERRRGRILFVSSMSGVLPGNPSVAVYSATKAFGKSLANSLGREMERFGVGVTVILPGAVKDTSFASRSNVEEAACFHFPGYAKTPELVASEGIEALMLGYPECYPGWQNRAFVKMFLPMLPPRASTMIGEWAWNPWQWGDVMPQKRRRGEAQVIREKEEQNSDNEISSTLSSPPPSASSAPSAPTWKFRRSSPSLPSNQMKLPDIPKERKFATDFFTDDASTSIELVDPSNQAAVDQNTTTITEKAESTLKSEETQNDRASVSPPTVSNAQPDTFEHLGESSSSTDSDNQKGGNKESTTQITDGEISEGKENNTKAETDSAAVLQMPAPPQPLVLPPASEPPPTETQPQASPLALFGFFDNKDSKSSAAATSSHEDLTTESKDEAKKDTVDAITEKNGGAADESPAEDGATWYPSMMDKKDYDFRDRRLDY